MDECVINEVIDELELAGMTAEAKRLRAEWERKIGHWSTTNPTYSIRNFPLIDGIRSLRRIRPLRHEGARQAGA